MMPRDPDGCWCGFNDRRPDQNVGVEEWAELCRLFYDANKEGNRAKHALHDSVAA